MLQHKKSIYNNKEPKCILQYVYNACNTQKQTSGRDGLVYQILQV